MDAAGELDANDLERLSHFVDKRSTGVFSSIDSIFDGEVGVALPILRDRKMVCSDLDRLRVDALRNPDGEQMENYRFSVEGTVLSFTVEGVLSFFISQIIGICDSVCLPLAVVSISPCRSLESCASAVDPSCEAFRT